MRFLLTSIDGLEDIAAAEAGALGLRVREAWRGKVIAEGEPSDIPRLNLLLRTVAHVVALVAEARVEDLEGIAREARGAEYSFLGRHQTFAVRAARHGSHGFTSVEVAAAVGGAIGEACRAARGFSPPVNLEHPAVEFRAWVIDDRFLLGVNTSGEGLHHRGYRVYQHPAPLNPIIAAAMLRLVGYTGGPLLDPLCGSATIPIEAARALRGLHNGVHRRSFPFEILAFVPPGSLARARREATEAMNRRRAPIVGLELFRRHLLGARLNARAAFVEDTVHLVQGRVEKPPLELPELVVTNPPYGLRVGSPGKVRPAYEALAAWVAEHPGTRLALVTAYPGVRAILAPLKLLEERRILYGNLPSTIYLYAAG